MVGIKRQFPDIKAISKLMKFKKPEFDATERRLKAALTVQDLRAIAQRRTPKGAFDYTDGAAEGEISSDRARQAFKNIIFHPEVLHGVGSVDTSTTVLGGPVDLPFGIAPTGFARMMQTEGEYAGAAAAGAAGIPFTLSTMGTVSVEDVKAVNPNGRNWFQLYLMKDRQVSYDLVERAKEVGYDTLLLTVDTPITGNRMRDVRNGFSIPPALTLGTIVDAIPRPAWWFNFLTTQQLEFASLTETGGTIEQLIATIFDPTLSWDDVAIVREMWPGNLVIKGIQTMKDARRSVEAGADGIVLSNHGGRQLDRAPVPFHMLPDVAAELGDKTEILLDTGVMNGADIVASIALGADLVLVGRAWLYGLMAGGRRGVDRMIEILRSEIVRTMTLLGVNKISDLNPSHVTQLTELGKIELIKDGRE